MYIQKYLSNKDAQYLILKLMTNPFDSRNEYFWIIKQNLNPDNFYSLANRLASQAILLRQIVLSIGMVFPNAER